ncbi:WD repeat-containing protein 91-like isoform X2 [Gymnodraco acuticeps]|uniref:WD repeat-containing protein 91-like isoform X2 n=1 Tax=Gymnodraco acuticeps TaxID=8218 RepID=A0A6P8VQA8_GYMAC|nr:WD repeat-containing protein 91-like isoform X2 [Gymnodraco acuticeps]
MKIVFSIGEDGKFIQWNIHRCGVKQSEQALAQDATGPFILSGYSGYKQISTEAETLHEDAAMTSESHYDDITQSLLKMLWRGIPGGCKNRSGLQKRWQQF